ncbi:MAG TPA: CsbD family protein [Candidatus Brachybacterium merdigallinarum]|nr:CsbD family protein [Candidatus Brachybacterium merdigallinarum]
MSNEDKFENKVDKLGGQAKEGFGKLTGDKETETQGKAEKSKADVKDKLQDAGDTVKGAAAGVFGSKDDDKRA